MSKEEILDNYTGLFSVKYPQFVKDAVLKAMEEYAQQQLAPSSEELCWLAWKRVYIINTHTGWEIGEDSPVHELHDWSMVKLEFDEWWEMVSKSKDAPIRGDLEQAKAAHSSPSLKHLKELLKTIRQETIPFTGHPDRGSILDCWNEVFEILDEQPAERAAQTDVATDDDWISVEDRLPELKTYWDKDYEVNMTEVSIQVWVSDGEDVWQTSFSESHKWPKNITHWRPLPKPPKQ